MTHEEKLDIGSRFKLDNEYEKGKFNFSDLAFKKDLLIECRGDRVNRRGREDKGKSYWKKETNMLFINNSPKFSSHSIFCPLIRNEG